MKNRKYDVTALGELLIDFTENGDSAQGLSLIHILRWGIVPLHARIHEKQTVISLVLF